MPGVVAAGDGVHGLTGESAARLAAARCGLACPHPSALPVLLRSLRRLERLPVEAGRSAGGSTPRPGLEGPVSASAPGSRRRSLGEGGGPPPSNSQPMRPPRPLRASAPARLQAAAAVSAGHGSRPALRRGPTLPLAEKTEGELYLLRRESGRADNTPAD